MFIDICKPHSFQVHSRAIRLPAEQASVPVVWVTVRLERLQSVPSPLAQLDVPTPVTLQNTGVE